jgi:tight adherence protein B
MRARRRRAILRELWPDAVDNIASGVRAGLALPEALGQLATRGPEELRPSFRAFAEDYRSSGRFHDCLDRLKASLSDPVGDRLIESLRIAREVGGSDLGRLLRTLSTFLREDSRTRSELEARQGWTVNAARLAVAAPWVVLGMLCTRPESIRAYATPTGTLVLVVGAVVSVVAYRVMIFIGRLPEDERVLR